MSLPNRYRLVLFPWTIIGFLGLLWHLWSVSPVISPSQKREKKNEPSFSFVCSAGG